MRHLLLFRGPDGAVDEGRDDPAFGYCLQVLQLEIHRDGPEHDFDGLDDVEDLLRKVQHGFFAAAAGSAPVERNFGLAGHDAITSSGRA